MRRRSAIILPYIHSPATASIPPTTRASCLARQKTTSIHPLLLQFLLHQALLPPPPYRHRLRLLPLSVSTYHARRSPPISTTDARPRIQNLDQPDASSHPTSATVWHTKPASTARLLGPSQPKRGPPPSPSSTYNSIIPSNEALSSFLHARLTPLVRQPTSYR